MRQSASGILGTSVDSECGKASKELLIWDRRSKILERIVGDVRAKYRPQEDQLTVMVTSRRLTHIGDIANVVRACPEKVAPLSRKGSPSQK